MRNIGKRPQRRLVGDATTQPAEQEKKPSGWHIQKLLVCSVGHIKLEDCDFLINSKYVLSVIQHRYGWIIRWDPGEYDEEDVPPAIRAVLEHAESLGCSVVDLDSDGPELDGLPVYDWESFKL